MIIVKAGLKGFKAPDLVGKCEHVEGSMEGNLNFPTPSPSLSDLKNARLALVAAIVEAESGAHAAIAKKNATAKTVADMITKMARYVNSVAGGDVEKAVSSGFELAKKRNPIDHLEAPTKFEGRTAAIKGQVDLRWKGVHGGRLYIVQMCDGDPASGGTWKNIAMVSRARHTVTGLESHKLYSFRVLAVGVVGEGPLSEVVMAEAA
jgi:hypothetical protein